MIRRSLRWQMTLAMWATSLVAAVFIFLGLIIYTLSSATITYEDAPLNDAVSGMDAPTGGQDGAKDLPGDETSPWSDVLAVLLIVLGGSAIGGMVGYRFARRLSRPIEVLASAARMLSAGDLTARAHHNGRQAWEIEKLTCDFNFMASELDKAQREQAESASAIAHELRTPVTVLRGRLQGIGDGVFELNHNTINGLIAQTETLGRIIDDLRTLTMAQSGRLEMTPVATDLATEADAVLAAIKPLVEKAGLSVRSSLQAAPVRADPIRMRQAIGALIDNAQRHAFEGSELNVETGENGGHSFLRVMDRGPGLGKDDAMRVFDRFWRADTSRSRQSGGSGLGLAVVRSICRGHGGDVRYTDRPGGGAVFEISIPVAEQPVEAPHLVMQRW